METKTKLGRRDFLRTLGAGAGVAAAASGAIVKEAAAADGDASDDKRKARYQANSPDVQAYYRVNRYPAK